MTNARAHMGIGDEVEFIGNGEPRYGRVEAVGAGGEWFKICLDSAYRTFRVENIACFRNITVEGPRPRGFRSIKVNGEND